MYDVIRMAAANMGLNEMAGAVLNQSVVHLLTLVQGENVVLLSRHFVKPRTVRL